MSVLDSDELEDELATLAAHLYAGTCRWLELVAEVDRRGEWAAQGAISCAHWLAWRCGSIHVRLGSTYVSRVD